LDSNRTAMSTTDKQLILQSIESHRTLLAKIEKDGLETIASAASAITAAIKQGGTVYICGNGGSAADAQHIAAELVGRFKTDRQALPAVALSTDTSILTSLANDYSYDIVFARQLQAFVKPGDILWALSTSGRSPNILAAVRTAKQKGAFILAFTGKNDSPLQHVADLCFCAEHEETARSQEMHELAYHIICDLVERNFNKNQPSP